MIVLECMSDKQRNEWLKALQNTRKRSWKSAKSKSDSSLDISSLTGRNSSAVLEEEVSSPTPVPPPRSPKPKKRTQIPSPEQESSPDVEAVEAKVEEEEEKPESTENTGEIDETQKTPEESTTEWYLNPNGQLNERSLQMPKVSKKLLNSSEFCKELQTIESPESVLKRLADSSIEGPIRALRRNLSSWKSGSRQNTVDEPVSRVSVQS